MTISQNTTFPGINTPHGKRPAQAPEWNRQRSSQMPSFRYRDAFARVDVPLEDRTWPKKRITGAPLWVPVDLRDGNQALAEPMDPERKRLFFELMVAMGYKEIEVGYPSASQTDFDFVRLLAEGELAPEDVTVVVFTAARRDLIERTVASIAGLKNPVVIHMYAATAPAWRNMVLGRNQDQLKELILAGARDILELAGHLSNVRFQFSPEVFNLTEPDYVLDVCNAVTDLWQATPERPVILNLPATVEIATPNVYADQIEYMDRNLDRRDSVILSVHPHNDRGTGIACAELAILAGAQRVEGCIFGNGERTGNVDLATLALNLHAQGVDPQIDFSAIDDVRTVVEHCTGLPLHPRHPYVGDLVHTAFSGTHQDAIRKGFAEHRERAAREGKPPQEISWQVPYLPVDPADLGRSYEAVIRVNSQSGKGGMAYMLEENFGLSLPRALEQDFAAHVQQQTDSLGSELSAQDLLTIFSTTYLPEAPLPWELAGVVSSEGNDGPEIVISLRKGAQRHDFAYRNCGVLEATARALSELGLPVEILALHQSSLHEPGAGGSNASDAVTLLEVRTAHGSRWVGARDASVLRASVLAVLAATL